VPRSCPSCHRSFFVVSRRAVESLAGTVRPMMFWDPREGNGEHHSRRAVRSVLPGLLRGGTLDVKLASTRDGSSVTGSEGADYDGGRGNSIPTVPEIAGRHRDAKSLNLPIPARRWE
jgi:hypothetical protein